MNRNGFRVLTLGALLLGAAAALRKPWTASVQTPRAAVVLRPTREPADYPPSLPASEPVMSSNVPAALPPAPWLPRPRLKAHLKLLAGRATLDELRASEAELRDELSRLTPDETVELLLDRPAPAAAQLILCAVDVGLRHDRETWETALVLGLEKGAADAAVLEELATAALGRLIGMEARDQAAGLLKKRATTDAHAVLAARLAPPK